MEQTTEDKILNATMQVIMEKSLSGVRLRAIAAEAGLVMSNLHYYYRTKEELLTALLEDILNKFQTMRQALNLEDRPAFTGQLAGFFEQKADILLNHQELDWVEIDFFGQMHHNERIRQYFIRSYNSWRDSLQVTIHRFYPGCPPEACRQYTHIIISMMVGASWQYLMDDTAFNLEGYFGLCLEVIASSIAEKYGDQSE